MSYLDMMCSICKVKPSDVEILGDTIVCEQCIELNLVEKNPYISKNKFPFTVGFVHGNEIINERFNVVRDIKQLEEDEKNI